MRKIFFAVEVTHIKAGFEDNPMKPPYQGHP
jgi:hypothetical protein